MNENIPEPIKIEFTSEMTKRELICALIWLPVHVILLPLLAGKLFADGTLNEAQANMLIYIAGAVYMLIAEFSFLRREYDPLCDHTLYCVIQIAAGYIAMLALNMCASGVVSLAGLLFGGDGVIDNLNNDSVMNLAGKDGNIISAMLIFLAPVVEETIFRGTIFGGLRKINRTAAYLVSTLLFAVYHVWQFALADPYYWLYILQYIPAGLLLARCYERTNSIWTGIFFHMVTNGIALKALSALGEIL